MVVGITGHQRLPEEAAWIWVEGAIWSALAEVPSPLIGISSLALGADQIFAALVLERSGELRVVLPFSDYVKTFSSGVDRERYLTLLKQAVTVEVLPTLVIPEESYFAAGCRVVEESDRMIAVWNGKEAAGLGGTGDVVRYALEKGRAVLHLDPIVQEIRLLHGRVNSGESHFVTLL